MSKPNSQKNNLLPRYHQTNKRQKPKPILQLQIPPTTPTSTHSSQSSHSSHSSHSLSNLNLKRQLPRSVPPKHHNRSLNVPSKTHHPSLPHLLMNKQPFASSKSKPLHHSPIPKGNIPPIRSHGIKRNLSHDTPTTGTRTNKPSAPLFHQIQHDINAYIQRFLFNASKKYWYANEYSASRDMIACTPLSTEELLAIHKQSYQETILDDEVRNTPKSHIYMIDARIGATVDKVYNGIYGIFQTFVDKNNHISFIYNDKLIHDKLCQINLVNIVSATANWKEYSTQLINQLSSELLGPYKSYALDKFKKLVHREFKMLTAIVCISNMKKNVIMNVANGDNTVEDRNSGDKKGHLISLLQQGIQVKDTEDAKSNAETPQLTPRSQSKVNINTITECHKELKRSLSIDQKKLNGRNQKILDGVNNKDKAKKIKRDTEDYVSTANEMVSARSAAYAQMKMYSKYVDDKGKAKSKGLMEEIDGLFAQNSKIVLYGKQLLDCKFACVAYNENIVHLKKEFHVKNKRFKKEIKDRIAIIKGIDLTVNDETESHYLRMSSKIASIVRFSKHNIKAGTMQILQTIMNNVKNMCPPRQNSETKEGLEDIDIDFNDVYSCNVLHESIVLELEKQEELCGKLLSKLHEYAVKKQKRLYVKMKQLGLVEGSKMDMKGPEFEAHEYTGDDIIFRVNETGEYAKGFLLVVWKLKIYRIYASEIAFQKGKDALIENHFKASDYGYNGLLTVDVRRSNQTKKTTQFKGYQFILARNAFVVKDMLSIKYWRNYIQRGENIRKASREWEETNHVNKSRARNDENKNYNNGRRRDRFLRKTRSSSLV